MVDDLGTGARHPGTDTRIAVKDYTRVNDESITDFLGIMEDDFDDNTSDANDLWLKLKGGTVHCEDSFIPTKLKKIKWRTPWITRTIIHLKRRVQEMRKKKYNSTMVSQLSRELKESLRSARDDFFSNT